MMWISPLRRILRLLLIVVCHDGCCVSVLFLSFTLLYLLATAVGDL